MIGVLLISGSSSANVIGVGPLQAAHPFMIRMRLSSDIGIRAPGWQSHFYQNPPGAVAYDAHEGELAVVIAVLDVDLTTAGAQRTGAGPLPPRRPAPTLRWRRRYAAMTGGP